MALKIVKSPGGGYRVSGLHPGYARYERDIVAGKIPCPYTVEFRNTAGEVVRVSPVALTPSGQPKELN